MHPGHWRPACLPNESGLTYARNGCRRSTTAKAELARVRAQAAEQSRRLAALEEQALQAEAAMVQLPPAPGELSSAEQAAVHVSMAMGVGGGHGRARAEQCGAG
eukprot:SAG25_NODE_2735_length_1415_cov_1.192249_3_plen_104_part_00